MTIDTQYLRNHVEKLKTIWDKPIKTDFGRGVIAGMDLVVQFLDIYDESEDKKMAEAFDGNKS